MLRISFALLFAFSFVPTSVCYSQGDSHQHPSEGPHGGELIEIGKEEFHAELVLDETQKQVQIFLSDAAAKSSVAIDAPFITINVKMNGKPLQFKLQAVSQEGDEAGTASCFSIKDSRLILALHQHASDPKLSLRIQSKSYVAKIAHNHAGHSHDHVGHQHEKANPKR